MPDEAPTPKALSALDLWKQRLLDLSKRNRALNFKPTRVSTVQIVDEVPGEMFASLSLRGDKLGFRARTEEAEVEGTTTPIEGESELSPSGDFAPYEVAALAERHRDGWLQTAHSQTHLDRALLRLSELAKSALDEQGVNPLFLALGMLHYRDTDDGETLRAPLVLVPVALERAGARSGFKVRSTDEDPIVNPALVEHLRLVHQVVLPALPVEGLPEGFELQTLLAQIVEAVGTRGGWRVADEAWLALFAFQKFVMYKDLEAHKKRFATHRVVRQIVERKVERLAGLPDDVAALELDREFPPETTAQVVDADASQLRAIAAVARGHDLVLEGPPGTGKSQTITNLIAQALSSGKNVLFVAEKMAALQVVHSRLSAVGLGAFCLELHSSKANKRAVLDDIRKALDASLRATAADDDAHRALPSARAALNDYVSALHAPFGESRRTPFQACGEFTKVADAERVPIALDARRLGPEAMDTALRAIRELVGTLEAVGDPRTHPWRDATKDFYAADDLAAIERLAGELRERFAHLAERVRIIAETYGFPVARTWADFERIGAATEVIARSPGAPIAVLESEAWNTPPSFARERLEALRKCQELRARALSNLNEDALSRDHSEDIAYVERKSSGWLSALAFLDGRYRAIRARWRSLRKPGYRPSLAEQAAEMERVQAYRAASRALEADRAQATALFGELWRGETSDLAQLDAYVAWVVEFRREVARCPLARRALEIASRPEPDLREVREVLSLAATAHATWNELVHWVGWPVDYLATTPLESLAERAAEISSSIARAPAWAAHAAAVARSRETIASGMVELAVQGRTRFESLEPCFLRCAHERFLEGAFAERPVLRQFSSSTHERRIEEFRRLDCEVLGENRASLAARLRDQVQERLRDPALESGKAFLLRQLVLQRSRAPLRRTMHEAGAAVRAIKPCFLMSPLTVAQLLDAEAPRFDLVVFDEASQLPAEDAIGTIARGRQIVVVGDSKQLPPTDFFRVSNDGADLALDEEGHPIVEDSESVLQEFASSGAPNARLKWHYRSRHEALIEFSNASFYDGELCTFPSTERSRSSGLEFVFVADGVYEGAGHNPGEVRAVAAAVVRHASETPQMSLGVGTFNLRQQLAIQDELERLRREDPALEAFFAPRASDGFFVKNLENIQGDERDVIFLSVTYGKSRDGRLRCNFGPINRTNGWRRLNVLATRARHAMRVFASIRADDIPVAATASPGPRLLKEFLAYAEHGTLQSARIGDAAHSESPLERDVQRELVQRGLQLEPQVGVSGYRIDFGVVDPERPGRFLCGLECDGLAYHASQTARDRDRLRQQVLEARGWTIHRIWSTDWFKDRAGQVERILRRVEECKRRSADAAALGAAPANEEPPLREDALLESAPPPRGRPKLARYRLCRPRAPQVELADAPDARVAKVMLAVAEAESPLHVEDLFARVLAAFGKSRTGSRIQARLESTLAELRGAGSLRLRDGFVWSHEDMVVPRDRDGTDIPAERVAPEEFRQAVRWVLEGGAVPAAQMVEAVCAALGLPRSRTARERVETALDVLIGAGTIGEGSSGYVLRA